MKNLKPYPDMISKLTFVYESVFYTLVIVILALISIFVNLSDIYDYLIDVIFFSDVIIGSILYLYQNHKKGVFDYGRRFILDILACIPVQFFAMFKVARLFRLVRIVRLIKLKKLNETEVSLTIETIFNVSTVKELSIYLLIYFIGNIYLFSELEHQSFIDSLYWLVATVTTVGYGDIHPTQNVTKLMAILLMIIGVASIGYMNGVITTTVVKTINAKHKYPKGKHHGQLKD
ncbi:MAG: potassium channel family protein [Lactococcus sp.]